MHEWYRCFCPATGIRGGFMSWCDACFEGCRCIARQDTKDGGACMVLLRCRSNQKSGRWMNGLGSIVMRSSGVKFNAITILTRNSREAKETRVAHSSTPRVLPHTSQSYPYCSSISTQTPQNHLTASYAAHTQNSPCLLYTSPSPRDS